MQKTKSSAGIRGKIFLYFIIFSVLLLTILWLFQTVLLDSFFKVIKRSQVERTADSIAELINDGDWDAVENAVLLRGDLFVEVWSKEGSQHVPGNSPEGLVPNDLDQEQKANLMEATRAAGGSLVSEERMKYHLGGDRPDMKEPAPGKESFGGGRVGGGNIARTRILCSKIVIGPEGEQALLIVSADISPLDATVETLRIQLICISVVMLVLALAIALLISRRVSRPIVQLNDSAQKLAKGDYQARFDAKGYREIEELSGTLASASRELAKTDSLRRELIANVSHDLRTPLTLITGYIEMMRDLPDENTPENMQVIIDETKRLTSLVNDLMDLSQLEAGTQEMRFEPFDLTAVVEGIIGRVQRFSEAEGYAIRYENGHPAPVVADETRISQVVYNFIINAMTHGGADKTITVRQFHQDGRVVLQVADSGPGIPPEMQDDIWERYFRAQDTHKRPIAGAGLGLSIVKNILQRHPGVEYGVESTPGQGSVFWFSLPLAPSPPAQ